MHLEIETDLPTAVKEMTYVKNCHYLRLKDQRGNETKLIEHGVIRYWCPECKTMWFQVENNASCCPSCAHNEISCQWMRPQVALIPEAETDFQMPRKKDDE